MVINELSEKITDDIGFRNVRIINITNIYNHLSKKCDYLLIELNTGQKILTNGKSLYDTTKYDDIFSILSIDNKLCAEIKKCNSIQIVNLETMEVIFDAGHVNHIRKENDKTLIVTSNDEPDKLYNLDTKEYILSKYGYTFEKALDEDLYVFREIDSEKHTNYYDKKRYVINSNGKIILENVIGWVDLYENHLINTKQDEICIAKINEDLSLTINSIKQNDRILAKPIYLNGNIVLIEKGAVKILTLDLEIFKEFKIDELDSIIDYEIVEDTLKLCLPYTLDEEKVNKHLFLNLNTGKKISHIRIEGFPYWHPTTYIGKDSLSDDKVDSFRYDTKYDKTLYHFYNVNFDKLVDIEGHYYTSIESHNQNMFTIVTWENNEFKEKFLNTTTQVLKDSIYENIRFSPNQIYGYGYNTITDKIDIIDENLNVIISNFDYKMHGLEKSGYKSYFSYIVINNFACFTINFIDNYGIGRKKSVIQNVDGEVVLDSINCKCILVGNYIHIVGPGKDEYLNTITGEIGPLYINAPINEDNKVDIKRIGNNSVILEQLLISSEDSKKLKKVNKSSN